MPTVTPDMLSRLMDGLDVLAAAAVRSPTCSPAPMRLPSAARGDGPAPDLTGRQGVADDGDLTAPGSFGNLPCGEGFVAPLSGEGTVATRSLASIGLVQVTPRISLSRAGA
jgi:hypothetical protein